MGRWGWMYASPRAARMADISSSVFLRRITRVAEERRTQVASVTYPEARAPTKSVMTAAQS